MSGITASFVFLFVCLMAAAGLASIDTHSVLLVVNDASPASVAIGKYYQSARRLPDINVCHLTKCPTDETVTAEVWHDAIKDPIWDYLTRPSHPWLKDQIKVILLTKGVPLWFSAHEWRDASTDMPLCYLGNASPTGAELLGWRGRRNSYYGQDKAFELFRPSADNQLTVKFPDLVDLCALGSGDLLAGSTRGLLFRKRGAAWSGVGDRQSGYCGTGIAALAGLGDSAWAVQAMYSRWENYGDGGRIIRSTDRGASWKEVRARTWDTDLLDIAFADANTGWAVGSQKDSASPDYLNLNVPGRKKRPLLLATTKGGDHDWHEVDLSSLALPEGSLTGLAVAAPDTVIACGENGIVLRGTKGGDAWTWSKVAVPAATYHGVAVAGAAGWVVGDGGKILCTTDGGVTWQEQVSHTELALVKVHAVDAQHAWATTGANTLLRTADGGATWEALTLPPDQSLQAILFTTARAGRAVGGRTVYATADGGATWTPEFVGPDTVWRVNYLVCRLDAYQTPVLPDGLPVDVKRMIDDAARPDRTGRFVLDQGAPGDGNGWAAEAAKMLAGMKAAGAAGIEEVLLDEAPAYLTDQKRVMGYCSWGSNDPNCRENTQWAKPRNQWQKGSISTTYVSTNARTLNYPPDYTQGKFSLTGHDSKELAGKLRIEDCWSGWRAVLHDADTGEERQATAVNGTIDLTLSHEVKNGFVKVFDPDGAEVAHAALTATPEHPFRPGETYGHWMQSRIADLLREGCTAAVANVTEPYLNGCGQPQYLFPRYVAGFPWAECAYMSLEWGGWREVALGDPLMAPYANPLQVTLTSPKSNATLTPGRRYTLSAAVNSKDKLPIQRVEFWISDGKQIDALVGTVTAAPYKLAFSAGVLPAPYSRPLPPGRYTIEAIAYADTNVREIGKSYRTVMIGHGK